MSSFLIRSAVIAVIFLANPSYAQCILLDVGCESRESQYDLGIDTYYYDRDAILAPYVGDSESIDRNADLVARQVDDSLVGAGYSWMVKVSGGLLPSFSRADNLEWDYSPALRYLGLYDSASGLDPGSYNYMVTGRVVLDRALQKLGVSDPATRDSISYVVLVGGSAAYQVKSDLFGDNHFLRDAWQSVPSVTWRNDPVGALAQLGSAIREGRTWYYEDKDDIRGLDMGFEHGRLLDLQRAARSVGVDFAPSDWGYRQAPAASPYRLLDEAAFLVDGLP